MKCHWSYLKIVLLIMVFILVLLALSMILLVITTDQLGQELQNLVSNTG
jgi:hypothetical protein